jgi:hypothetical protein
MDCNGIMNTPSFLKIIKLVQDLKLTYAFTWVNRLVIHKPTILIVQEENRIKLAPMIKHATNNTITKKYMLLYTYA